MERRGAIESVNFRTTAVDGVLQTLDQGGPVHLTLVTDDVQSWQAAALHDSVAVVRWFQTGCHVP